MSDLARLLLGGLTFQSKDLHQIRPIRVALQQTTGGQCAPLDATVPARGLAIGTETRRLSVSDLVAQHLLRCPCVVCHTAAMGHAQGNEADLGLVKCGGQPQANDAFAQ